MGSLSVVGVCAADPGREREIDGVPPLLLDPNVLGGIGIVSCAFCRYEPVEMEDVELLRECPFVFLK